jgi:hypothetical protein
MFILLEFRDEEIYKISSCSLTLWVPLNSIDWIVFALDRCNIFFTTVINTCGKYIIKSAEMIVVYEVAR